MEIILLIIGGLVGAAGGFVGKTMQTKRTLGEAEDRAKKQLADAETEAKKIVLDAKEEAAKLSDEIKREDKERQNKIMDAEKRILEREEALDRKLDELDKRSEGVRKQEDEINKFKDELKNIRTEQLAKLEKIAGLKKPEAAEKLMQMTERDIKEDLMGLIGKLQRDAEEEAEDKAQMVIVSAMERMASDVSAERTVTTVELPDEMKGRIIGKEGRNIQAIERATGVDVLVDDTPGVVVLSGFDPVRRQIARLTLEMLIKDGRIHPGRIEETVQKAQNEIDKEIDKAAENAVREVGLTGIPPEIMRHLGELKFRTSYGQNVLKHSTEMAHLAGMIAQEIGADITTSKYAALIHDIGKTLTHKIEGKHHHITGQIARKFGVPEAVAHAAEAHHDDLEATTPEAIIVRVVDAISGARPGGRNISAEDFVKRMRDLENVANEFEGVEKAYAISAGREIRVMVHPQSIDDLSAIKMARDIATKIESTMQYPGTIKVNVIRETRAVEYAK